MNTTIDLKTAKTIEAMNQKINHMDNAVTDFFNKMSDVLERQRRRDCPGDRTDHHPAGERSQLPALLR